MSTNIDTLFLVAGEFEGNVSTAFEWIPTIFAIDAPSKMNCYSLNHLNFHLAPPIGQS